MPTRREILAVPGAIPAAGLLTGSRVYAQAAARFPRRLLGRTGRKVVPLALGGQASLQWTKPGIDAPDIVVRAVQLGLNYLDTANAYGPSQSIMVKHSAGSIWFPGRPASTRRRDRACLSLPKRRDSRACNGALSN